MNFRDALTAGKMDFSIKYSFILGRMTYHYPVIKIKRRGLEEEWKFICINSFSINGIMTVLEKFDQV